MSFQILLILIERNMVINFYRQLYVEDGVYQSFVVTNAFPQMEEEWLEEMSRIPSNAKKL